jgi:hypothetical protein
LFRTSKLYCLLLADIFTIACVRAGYNRLVKRRFDACQEAKLGDSVAFNDCDTYSTSRRHRAGTAAPASATCSRTAGLASVRSSSSRVRAALRARGAQAFRRCRGAGSSRIRTVTSMPQAQDPVLEAPRRRRGGRISPAPWHGGLLRRPSRIRVDGAGRHRPGRATLKVAQQECVKTMTRPMK